MTKNYLEKNYVVSSYNENTNEQMDYYINEKKNAMRHSVQIVLSLCRIKNRIYFPLG